MSHLKKDRSVHFHVFSQEGRNTVQYKNKLNIVEKVDCRKAWIIALKIGKPATKGMIVCSKHFLLSDYLPKKPSK